MIGRVGERFSNKIIYYGASLSGTWQYWLRERNLLIAMIDTLGLPTLIFIHYAADYWWPELQNPVCPKDPEDKIQKGVDAYYINILKATNYWMRFEWQQWGSPHVHGQAWLPNAPNVENLSSFDLVANKQEIEYADKIISNINLAVLQEGSNVSDAPPPESYCLQTHNGKQECQFGYPNNLQAQTNINIAEEEPVIVTARNDGMLNTFNPIQLTFWNVKVVDHYMSHPNNSHFNSITILAFTCQYTMPKELGTDAKK
uniref:Helitron helicase-like domain-containing protein n=1 Tax=Amphimedon queenslandica TaxID=400682 RepID=A0A1X7TVI2_AMPQE